MTHSSAAYDLAVAQAIHRYNEQHGLSRGDLAQALGIAELQVTRLEGGTEPLTAGMLMVLLRYYGLSLGEFAGKVEDELPMAQSRIDRASHSPSE